MISAMVSRIIILVFGNLYPAFASYKAVKTRNVREYVRWMMYWIVFALFTCAENITDMFFSFWFPLYYEIKILVVIFLLSPATRGSSILYRKFVHPMFSKREEEIEEYINRAKEQGYSTVFRLGTQGVRMATSFIMQTALKGGGELMSHLRRTQSLGDLDVSDVNRNVKAIALTQHDEGDGREDVYLPEEDSAPVRRRAGRSRDKSTESSHAQPVEGPRISYYEFEEEDVVDLTDDNTDSPTKEERVGVRTRSSAAARRASPQKKAVRGQKSVPKENEDESESEATVARLDVPICLVRSGSVDRKTVEEKKPADVVPETVDASPQPIHNEAVLHRLPTVPETAAAFAMAAVACVPILASANVESPPPVVEAAEAAVVVRVPTPNQCLVVPEEPTPSKPVSRSGSSASVKSEREKSPSPSLLKRGLKRWFKTKPAPMPPITPPELPPKLTEGCQQETDV